MQVTETVQTVRLCMDTDTKLWTSLVDRDVPDILSIYFNARVREYAVGKKQPRFRVQNTAFSFIVLAK